MNALWVDKGVIAYVHAELLSPRQPCELRTEKRTRVRAALRSAVERRLQHHADPKDQRVRHRRTAGAEAVIREQENTALQHAYPWKGRGRFCETIAQLVVQHDK